MEKPLEKPQDKKLNTAPLQNKTAQEIHHSKSESKEKTALEEQSEHKHHDSSKNTIEADSKEKKEDKKAAPAKIAKKEEAIAKGFNLHASKKHCMYISSFIKGKDIDSAISDLQLVIKLKKVVPFKGEIPHRHAAGIMSGRYPVNASKQIIYILKALKGNSIVNGLDLHKTKIFYASASWASRPAKKGGMRFKRTNLILKAKEFPHEKHMEKKQ